MNDPHQVANPLEQVSTILKAFETVTQLLLISAQVLEFFKIFSMHK